MSGALPWVTSTPWSTACLTRSMNASLPGWPMIAMQDGLAASACLNCSIIFSGAQPENCSFRLSRPSAWAAAAAPVWRASVAPSPGLPPICMYMVMPLPGGSAAIAVPAATAMAAVARSRLRMAFRPPLVVTPAAGGAAGSPAAAALRPEDRTRPRPGRRAPGRCGPRRRSCRWRPGPPRSCR